MEIVIWAWVKIRYSNNQMVNTKHIHSHLWSHKPQILTHTHMEISNNRPSSVGTLRFSASPVAKPQTRDQRPAPFASWDLSWQKNHTLSRSPVGLFLLYICIYIYIYLSLFVYLIIYIYIRIRIYMLYNGMFNMMLYDVRDCYTMLHYGT